MPLKGKITAKRCLADTGSNNQSYKHNENKDKKY